MAALQVTKLVSVLARCLPSDLKNAAKFKVKLMEFDPYLNMVSSNMDQIPSVLL